MFSIYKANNSNISNCVFFRDFTNCYFKITFNGKSGIFYAIGDSSLENQSLVLNQLQRVWFNVTMSDNIHVEYISEKIC